MVFRLTRSLALLPILTALLVGPPARAADPGQIIHLTSGGHRLIEMLIANRADLVLTTEEEARTFAADGVGGPDYPIIHFADIQTGDARSIMCSRSVSDQTIARLDGAIQAP